MNVTTKEFRSRELDRFAGSGWARIDWLRSRLSVDPGRYLRGRPTAWWSEAASQAAELHRLIASFKFVDDVVIGLLFVPATSAVDTRQPVDATVRRMQRRDLTQDLFDERLGPGRDLVPQDSTGRFFLTIVGQYGVSAGSYQQVATASGQFTVGDIDTREAMTRQLWGARVLQAGDQFLPDTETNTKWTFTLFAGDELNDGLAASGTILKSRVRFRLGKPDRGIASARVSPAIPMDAIPQPPNARDSPPGRTA